MYHLDVVSGTGFPDPVTAGLAVDLSSGSLEYFFDGRPRSGGTARHKGRTITSTLLATRNTRSDEQEALSLELLGATDRIGIVRVTTVDDDVARIKIRLKLGDKAVNGRTSLDEEDNLAWTLELGDELLNRVCALNFGAWEGG